jgi:hypothetical protein
MLPIPLAGFLLLAWLKLFTQDRFAFYCHQLDAIKPWAEANANSASTLASSSTQYSSNSALVGEAASAIVTDPSAVGNVPVVAVVVMSATWVD